MVWTNPWRRQWQPTLVLLPGKSHGWWSLVGCSPWGREELDTTERLHFHFSFSCIGEGNGNTFQCSCLENPRDGGAWWAAVYGVAQSRTRLKWLSSSSSSSSRIEQTKQHFPVLIFFNWWKIAHLFYFHLCFIFVLVQPVYLYPLLFFYWSFGLFSLFLCTNYLYLVC